MKSMIIVSVLFSLVTYAAVSIEHPWSGKTLSADEVKARWGKAPLDEEKFKKGTVDDRQKMAYSVLTSKALLGLSAAEIRSRLGDFDGHYFSASYPTYLIQIASDMNGETLQIVFLIDRDRKTKAVIVHKNCCD